MTDSLRLENQLCHRLYLLSNAFTRAYRPLLDKIGITYPQYIVMMALWEADNLTIASLVEKTGVDAGAMSLILKKLSAKGLLLVQKGETDKRERYVLLTPPGKELEEEARSIPSQMQCKFANVDSNSVNELILHLDNVQAALKMSNS